MTLMQKKSIDRIQKKQFWLVFIVSIKIVLTMMNCFHSLNIFRRTVFFFFMYIFSAAVKMHCVSRNWLISYNLQVGFRTVSYILLTPQIFFHALKQQNCQWTPGFVLAISPMWNSFHNLWALGNSLFTIHSVVPNEAGVKHS